VSNTQYQYTVRYRSNTNLLKGGFKNFSGQTNLTNQCGFQEREKTNFVKVVSEQILEKKTIRKIPWPLLLVLFSMSTSTQVRTSSTELWETEELKTGHYVHLSHSDNQEQTHKLHPRIVFLHGLTQSLECWRGTAERLHQSSSLLADVVLIDMIGHGKTRTPGGLASRVRPDVMCRQVQRVLEEIGWMSTTSYKKKKKKNLDHDIVNQDHHTSSATGGVKMILCGLSLGGAVSLLWSEQHLDSVARVVRVAAAGLDEKWWHTPISTIVPKMCCSTGLPRMITSLTSSMEHSSFACLTQVLGHAFCGMGAPSYGVNQRIPEMFVENDVPVAVVAGTLDFLHRPHLKRWKPDVVVLRFGWEHVLMCNLLDYLRLDENVKLWRVRGSSSSGGAEVEEGGSTVGCRIIAAKL
jgi:pimeloyl-ACP methyl ester carboxylesterase